MSLDNDVIRALLFSATSCADAALFNQGDLSGERFIGHRDGPLALADGHLARFALKGRKVALHHQGENLSANRRQILRGVIRRTLGDFCLSDAAVDANVERLCVENKVSDCVDRINSLGERRGVVGGGGGVVGHVEWCD